MDPLASLGPELHPAQNDEVPPDRVRWLRLGPTGTYSCGEYVPYGCRRRQDSTCSRAGDCETPARLRLLKAVGRLAPGIQPMFPSRQGIGHGPLHRVPSFTTRPPSVLKIVVATDCVHLDDELLGVECVPPSPERTASLYFLRHTQRE